MADALTRRNLRIGVIAVSVIVVLIVLLQNTDPVQTRILFATVSMPRAVLLVVMLALGFVLGLLVRIRPHKRGEAEP